jgi:hypothetical protein
MTTDRKTPKQGKYIDMKRKIALQPEHSTRMADRAKDDRGYHVHTFTAAGL